MGNYSIDHWYCKKFNIDFQICKISLFVNFKDLIALRSLYNKGFFKNRLQWPWLLTQLICYGHCHVMFCVAISKIFVLFFHIKRIEAIVAHQGVWPWIPSTACRMFLDKSNSHLHCDICQMGLCKQCVGTHIVDGSKKHKVVPYNKRASSPYFPKCIPTSNVYFTVNSVPLCVQCISSNEHNSQISTDILQWYAGRKEGLD